MSSPETLLTATPTEAAEAERLHEHLTNGTGLHDLVARLVQTADAAALETLMEGRVPLHDLLDQHAGPYGRPASDLGWPYRAGESAHTHATRALAAAGLAALNEDDARFADAARRWYLHCRSSSDEPGTSTTLAGTIASLSGKLAPRHTASVGVLLARADEGRTAELRVFAESTLPQGVAPHPPTMALFTGDDDFRSSLLMAYQQTRTVRGAVLWSLRAADGPVDHVVGASLGAAFAVALDELARRQRRLTAWSRLRRLPSETYVVGRLLPSGTLGSVTGYDAKARGLGHRSRLIVPSADVPGVRDTGGVVTGAATWQAAAKAARRFDRWAVARLVLVLVLLAGGVAGTYAYRADRARERSDQLATATRVAQDARRLAVGGDGIGLLLAMASDDLAAAAGQPTTVFEDLSQDKGSLVHIFRPKHGAYRHVEASPDGRLAVIATDVGLVQLVDTRTTNVLWSHTYPPGFQLSADQVRITAVAFSRDGTLAAVGTSDRKITVLGLREGAWLPVLALTVPGQSPRGPAGYATSIDALAFGDGVLYAVGRDGLTGYALDDGEYLGHCAAPADVIELHAKDTGAVLVVADHVDHIAVPSCRQRRLWTAAGGVAYAGVTSDKAGTLIAVATKEAQLMAVQPDGTSTVVAADGPYDAVRIRNTNRGVRVTAARDRAVGGERTYLWDVERNAITASLPGYGRLAVGGEHLVWLHDGMAELHSMGSDTFAAVAVFDQRDVSKARWAGSHLLVATYKNDLYALLDVRNRRSPSRVTLLKPADKAAPHDVTGDPNGKFAAAIVYTGHADRQLRVWDLPSGHPATVPQLAEESPNDVRFVGGRMYVAYRSGALRVFRASTSGWELEKQTTLGSPVALLRQTHDGKRLVALAAVSDHNGPIMITTVDADSLAIVGRRELNGPVGNPGMDVLPDGRIVVANGAGAVVFLGPDLAVRHETTAREAAYITDATYVPSMRQVIVSSRMRSYVYDTDSYAEVSDLYWDRAGHVLSADVSADGALLAAVNPVRADVSLWSLRVADRRTRACRAIGRDLTSQEWVTYVGNRYPFRSVCSANQIAAGPPETPSAPPVEINADHIGPYRLGMTLAEVRQAANVPLDRDDTCGFYTFRGSEPFSAGDGPTFFFDTAGRLDGMLLGHTIFGREVRADGSVTIGSPYTDLRSRYGARLMPRDDTAATDTVWVKGNEKATLAFDLSQERRVTGFRVGTQAFVTAFEFCG